MQRLGCTWHVHVHVHRHARAKTQHPYLQIVRHISNAEWGNLRPAAIKPDTPTFNINNLLLELDSETTKNVRQFDPDIDGEPHPDPKYKRNLVDEAVSEKIRHFRAIKHDEKQNFESMVTNRDYEWHVNDLDIVDQVLRISTREPRQTSEEARDNTIAPLYTLGHHGKNGWELQNEVLARNGIPQSATHIPARFTTYLLHKQKEARAQSSAIIFEDQSSDSLSAIIRRQASFLGLKRVIRFLLETPNGSQLLSKVSGEIGEVCFELAISKSAASYKHYAALQALLLSNDIVLNLLARGLPVDKHLWALGLRLALGVSAFSAARMYLAAATYSGSTVKPVPGSLLESLDYMFSALEKEEASHNGTYTSSSLSLSQHRAAIFSLLTGCDANGHHSPFSIHSMMQSVEHSDHAAFGCYLEILGELGAIRTLWHIYHQLPKIVQPQRSGRSVLDPPTEVPTEVPTAILDYFVQAFSRIARNIALGRISLKDLEHDIDAEPKFEGDCQLDLETIRRSGSTKGSVAVEIGSVEDASEFLARDIHQAFGETAIGQSLGMLRRLLVESQDTKKGRPDFETKVLYQ